MFLHTPVSALLLLLTLRVLKVAADEVIIDPASFDSYAAFEGTWNYLYPWGSDHNGGARMIGNSSDHSHISLSDSVLTLTATPVTGQPPSTSNPKPPINYFSGAVHAKEHLTIDGTDVVGYTIEGEFVPSLVYGTWPAFWLTAVNSWPPESDIGEWKGDANNWFNTFNTSSAVLSKIVSWPKDGAFHSVKAVLRAVNDADVSIEYSLDGTVQATHIGANFVNSPLYLIVNLQMEGSSGTPGPTGTTTYKARNIKVTSLTA